MRQSRTGSITIAALTLTMTGVLNSAAKAADPAPSKGELIAIAGDCAGCHANPDGSSEYSGGFAFATPMGTIIARNITSDPETGIGDWTYEEFDAALRRGKSKTLGNLYPAMPYTSYRNMSDDDVRALYDYVMKEVAPQKNEIAKTSFGFPFLRVAVFGWNIPFASSGREPDPKVTDPQLRRGDYLVNVLGHCGECHTTRGILFQTKSSSAHLAGAVVGGWYAPNITSSAAGVGDWSDEQLKQFLRRGKNKKAVAGGDMGLAVRMSLAKLPESDLDAIIAYLRSTEPDDANPVVPVATNVAPLDIAAVESVNASFNDYIDTGSTDGAALYQAACASCHGADGALDDGGGPNLTLNSSVRAPNPTNVVQAINAGVELRSMDRRHLMPPFGSELSPKQIAAVATYVRQRFGGIEGVVRESEVNAIISGRAGIPWLLLNARWLAGLGIAALIVAAIAGFRTIRGKGAQGS